MAPAIKILMTASVALFSPTPNHARPLPDVKSTLNPREASMNAEALRASLKEGWAPRNLKDIPAPQVRSLKTQEELGAFEDSEEIGPDQPMDQDHVDNETHDSAEEAKDYADDTSADETVAVVKDPVEVMLSTPHLEVVGNVFEDTNMVMNITDCEEEWTILAPKNDACERALDQGDLGALLEDTEALEEIFELHILPGIWTMDDLTDLAVDGDVVKTMSGDILSLTVDKDSKALTVQAPEGGSKGHIKQSSSELETGIRTCSGLIHTIDNVLVPGDFVELTLVMPEEAMPDPVKIEDSADNSEQEATDPIPEDPVPAPAPAPAPLDPVPESKGMRIRAFTSPNDPNEEEIVEEEEAVEVEEIVEETATAPPTGQLNCATDKEDSFDVCINKGTGDKYFGFAKSRDSSKHDGVVIAEDGSCDWGEYAGGFDGFPSSKIDDGHEPGMDEAITQMLPCSKEKQTRFLQKMIEIADPVNLDYPEDIEIADGGKRVESIEGLNKACESLINVVNC